MSSIDGELQRRGPCQSRRRFSLPDIVLSFWVEYDNVEDALTSCPALLRCLDRVGRRLPLQPLFDELIEDRLEYARLQQTGAGAK